MKDSKELTLNEAISHIRVELQNTKIKKSGKNKFAGFEYYELADFLPTLNKLEEKYGVNDLFTIGENAELTLIKGEERQTYKLPFTLFETPVNIKYSKNGEMRKVKSMQDIQYLGALNTYYKRYLYINAIGITDGEIIDSMENNEEIKEEQTIDYKQLVNEEIKKQGLDVRETAKKYHLNPRTTQAEARIVLEEMRRNNAS